MILINTIKKNPIRLLLSFTILSFFSGPGIFAQAAPTLIFAPVVSGLSSPVDIVNAKDGSNRLFIVCQGGTVRILSNGTLLPGNFLDIPDSITAGGETGLLSLAFHPNYINNRYFFIYYTTTSGSIRITRFQTQAGNPNAADETTGAVLLTIPHPGQTNHNGGKLNFGPDGNLYFGTGDGGGSGDPNNNAQNGNLLLGKMIRINVDNFTTPPYYTIPSDNPYLGDPNVRDEIFDLGLRNPWRWSFDRLNGDVWIADVGQGAREEINRLPFASSGGLNYGWRCYEGNSAYNTTGCQPQSSYTSPIFDYPHSSATGGFSVTGGYVYRGTLYGAMYGYYICSDYVSANTWLIKSNGSGGWNVTRQGGLPGSIVGYGEAENGDLYNVSLGGTVYKVTTNSGGPLPVTLLQFSAKAFTGYNELKWRTTNEQNLAYYEIEFSNDGVNYLSAGKLNAINNPSENNYSFQHFIPAFSKLFYRLRISDKDGRSTYSGIVELNKIAVSSIKIYPTPVTNNQVNIISEKPVEQIAIFSAEGKNVFQSRMNNASGTINVMLPTLQKGVYIVQLKLKDEKINGKIIISQ